MNWIIIAFEGIDGSGLTTHSRLLARALREKGLRVGVFKEPSHGPVGEIIRSVLRGGGARQGVGAALYLSLLFAADRVQQFYGEVLGFLSSSERCVAVYDRYKYSSIVYQGLLGAPTEWLRSVNSVIPPPHILVFLDVEPRVAYERLRRSRGRLEAFEEPRLLEELYAEYQALLSSLEERPEYCGGEALWASLLERRGVEPGEHWPPGKCYPLLVVVKGSRNGRDRSVGEVAGDVYAGVARAAATIGFSF